MFATSISGLSVATREIGIISDNIANVGTNGFKKNLGQFEDVYQRATADSDNLTIGSGARMSGTRQVHSQGALKTTNTVTDIAIAGDGMFVVRAPNSEDGLRYTRNGSFGVDEAGNLVTKQGLAVLNDVGEPIVIPHSARQPNNVTATLSELEIDPQGQIFATYGGTERLKIATLGMVRVNDPSDIERTGTGYYQQSGDGGLPTFGTAGTDGFGTTESGFLEVANVDLTQELTALIRAQQVYSGSAKALQTIGEMDSVLIDR